MRRLAIGVLLAALLLPCAYCTFVGTPTPESTDASRAAVRFRQQAAVVASDEEARDVARDMVAASREAVGGRVPVRGRLAGVHGSRRVRLAAGADTGAPAMRVLAEGDSDASGEFDIACPGPISQVRMEVGDSTGLVFKQVYSRPGSHAMEAWDLGVLRLGITLNLGLRLHYDYNVVRALCASRQTSFDIEIRAERPNGPLLDKIGLDLTSLTERPFGSWSHESCLAAPTPDCDIFVRWACHTDRRLGSTVLQVETMRHVETLPGTLGSTRRSTLSLYPEGLLMGVVVSSDGSPWSGIPVEYRSDDAGRLTNVVCRTDRAGRFALYVGVGESGRVSLSGRLQLEIARDDGVRAAAGTTVRIELPVRKIRFRLVDDAGRPIETYRVRSKLTALLSEDLLDRERHADGVAWFTDVELRNYPWLRFDSCGRKGVFIVPSSWAADRSDVVHDVSMSSLHSLGVLSINARVRTNEWPREAAIALRGQGPLLGYHLRWLTAPRSSVWRIDGLPAGDYEYTLRTSGGETTGRATIAADRESALVIDLP